MIVFSIVTYFRFESICTWPEVVSKNEEEKEKCELFDECGLCAHIGCFSYVTSFNVAILEDRFTLPESQSW